ncbi:hypothetical protein V6N13_146882 [Hibiscus sabdariffa]
MFHEEKGQPHSPIPNLKPPPLVVALEADRCSFLLDATEILAKSNVFSSSTPEFWFGKSSLYGCITLGII